MSDCTYGRIGPDHIVLIYHADRRNYLHWLFNKKAVLVSGCPTPNDKNNQEDWSMSDDVNHRFISWSVCVWPDFCSRLDKTIKELLSSGYLFCLKMRSIGFVVSEIWTPGLEIRIIYMKHFPLCFFHYFSSLLSAHPLVLIQPSFLLWYDDYCVRLI